MKKLLLIGVGALFLATGTAHAVEDITCSAPKVILGDDQKVYVIRVDVLHDIKQNKWKVHHIVTDGPDVWREQQYDIMDGSDDRKSVWTGNLKANENIFMAGKITRNPKTGKLVYSEKQYDLSDSWTRRKGAQWPKQPRMHMVADCEHKPGLDPPQLPTIDNPNPQ